MTGNGGSSCVKPNRVLWAECLLRGLFLDSRYTVFATPLQFTVISSSIILNFYEVQLNNRQDKEKRTRSRFPLLLIALFFLTHLKQILESMINFSYVAIQG